MCGSMHPLPRTSPWRSVCLTKHKDSFTFYCPARINGGRWFGGLEPKPAGMLRQDRDGRAESDSVLMLIYYAASLCFEVYLTYTALRVWVYSCLQFVVSYLQPVSPSEV
jgi:hypothetical protein